MTLNHNFGCFSGVGSGIAGNYSLRPTIKNQQVMNEIVQNIEQSNNLSTFKCTYEKVVKQLIENRNTSKSTQDMVAKWLNVDRRKIIDFENLTRFDVELMCRYSDIFGIDLYFKHIVT